MSRVDTDPGQEPHADIAKPRFADVARTAAPPAPANGPAVPPPRRPRADARDNRQRLLAAADVVFGAAGIGASLDLVARQAGVGRATLYRHFPSREALLTALHNDLLTSIEDQASSLATRDDGLFDLLAFYTEYVARRATLMDYWLSLPVDSTTIQRGRGRLRIALEPVIARAIDTGHCQPGVTPADVLMLLRVLTPHPVGGSGEERRAQGRRTLELLLMGLRRPTGF